MNRKKLFHKNRFLKKMVAVLIVVSVVLLGALDVYAQQPYSNAEFAVSLDIISYNSPVLTSDGSGNGHSFIVVHNFNSYAIQVGHMRVPSNESVTVSVFDNRANHKGVWYNIEGYHASAIENASPARLSTGLSQEELNTLNSYINNYDYYSLASNNCSQFSKRCWNAVSDVKLSGGIPTLLRNSIVSHGGSTSGVDVPNKSISSIAYQTSTSVKSDSSGAYDSSSSS